MWRARAIRISGRRRTATSSPIRTITNQAITIAIAAPRVCATQRCRTSSPIPSTAAVIAAEIRIERRSRIVTVVSATGRIRYAWAIRTPSERQAASASPSGTEISASAADSSIRSPPALPIR